jgi:hypothetical protein
MPRCIFAQFLYFSMSRCLDAWFPSAGEDSVYLEGDYPLPANWSIQTCQGRCIGLFHNNDVPQQEYFIAVRSICEVGMFLTKDVFLHRSTTLYISLRCLKVKVRNSTVLLSRYWDVRTRTKGAPL